MTHYLIAVHRPDDYDPELIEDDAMRHDIILLNQEMIVAGVRLFVGGLQPPDTATTLRPKSHGEVAVTPGPRLHTGDHISGLWVIEVETPEEALAWARKAALACRAEVEVRPFH